MFFDVNFAQILSFGPPSQTYEQRRLLVGGRDARCAAARAVKRARAQVAAMSSGVTLTVIEGRILHRIGRGLNGILRFKMNFF